MLNEEWAVHWLEIEKVEVQVRKHFRCCPWLREYELQFVAGTEQYLGSGFWAHTYPVNTRGGGDRAIGLDGYFKPLLVQCLDEGFIELQEWLPSGTNYVWGTGASGPQRCDCCREGIGRIVFSTESPIRSPEVGIAKPADCVVPVFFTSAPEVAAGEAAENSGAAALRALSLKGEKDFFYGIHKLIRINWNVGKSPVVLPGGAINFPPVAKEYFSTAYNVFRNWVVQTAFGGWSAKGIRGRRIHKGRRQA